MIYLIIALYDELDYQIALARFIDQPQNACASYDLARSNSRLDARYKTARRSRFVHCVSLQNRDNVVVLRSELSCLPVLLTIKVVEFFHR